MSTRWLRLWIAMGALSLSAGSPVSGEEPTAIQDLREAAGDSELPTVPPAEGAPDQVAPVVPPSHASLVCTMSLSYREKVVQLIVFRFWKELEGDAAVSCPGHEEIRLRLQGSGPSLGLGVPNQGPFTSVNEIIAGSVQIHVPAPFVAQNFEGDYINAGAEIGGVGGSLSPWVNTDASLRMAIYLPQSFNASAAVNLQRLRLYLMP